MPERLEVGDWLDEDLPSQAGAAAADEHRLALVRHDDPDGISDLVMAPAADGEMAVRDLGEDPYCPDYAESFDWELDDLPTFHGRLPANDLTI